MNSFDFFQIASLVHIKQELMEINDLLKKQSEELSSIKKVSTSTFDLVNSALQREALELDGYENDEEADIKEVYRKIIDEYIKVARLWENITEETEG